LFDWIWVALGGALGSVLRYQVAGTVQRWNGSDWPLGTLAVNLLGSLVIGGLAHMVLARGLLSAEARLFMMVGILGGFTTFSTFSMETLRLLQQGAWEHALANMALSVAGGLAAAWAGFVLAGLLWP
jgi:CrcB protein